jgi:hypothetical protein
MSRRFNIGDRVVRFNPSLYGSLFHKEKYVDYGVVTDANDDRFTTKGKLTNFDNGTNYNECFQSSGKLVYGGYTDDITFWFNMDTEMELIENFHKKTEEQFLNEIRTKNNDEIERMKLRIKSLEEQIKRLESMEDAYMGYTTIKTFQHLGEMENIFQNKLDKCNKLYKR